MKTNLEAIPEALEIDPNRTTVLIIDMQNACIAKGGMFNLGGLDISEARKAIDPINQIAMASRSRGRKVIFIQHQYAPDFREIGDPDSVLWTKSRSYILYNERPEWRDKLLLRGTWGAEIDPELTRDENDIFVEKSRYTAFWGTNLDTILRTLNTRYLFICGAWANMCVEATLRDASNYGYYPILIKDAVAATNVDSLENTVQIAGFYGWVTTSVQYIRAIAST